MARRKKVEKKPRKQRGAVIVYEGHKQVGDARYYNTDVMTQGTLAIKPKYIVGPGDIVDKIEPAKRWTFWHFHPGTPEQSADELSRLKERGYVPCKTDRFFSLTKRFEDDGPVVKGYGSGIWYACPYERYLDTRQESLEDAKRVANVHRGAAEDARKLGFEVTQSSAHDRQSQLEEQ
jgi:hypothetical protein